MKKKKTGCFSITIGAVLLAILFIYVQEIALIVLIIIAIAIAFYAITNLLSNKKETPPPIRKHSSPTKYESDFIDKTESNEETEYEKYITHKKNNQTASYTPLLTGVDIYLSDILADIKIIRDDSIDDFQHSIHRLPDKSVLISKYNNVVLYDIAKIAYILEIDITIDSAERNIIIFSFSFFYFNEDFSQILFKQNEELEIILKKITSLMNAPHPLKANDIILGKDEFKNYRPDYIKKLREIVTLITTIDFNLTKKEEQVLEYFKMLENS